MSTTITTTQVSTRVGPATLVGRQWTVTPLMPWSGDVSAAATTYTTRNAAKTKTIDVYLGVKYAVPPTGTNRWKPATDYDYPGGSYDCGTWPDVPYQSYISEYDTDGRPEWGVNNGAWNWSGYGVSESEDIAKLNIWRPTGAAPTGGWPVIFWVHGGAWTVNSAIAYQTRGHRQAVEGAIVVTVEYPLSNFGHFYATEFEGEAVWDTPSFAYTYILSALRWVNRNIASFGGSPTKLCIGGSSAGGAAVLGLLEDTAANGLYTSAWVTSGGGNGERYGPNEAHTNLGYAQYYEKFRTAIDAAAPYLKDYSMPSRTLEAAIIADGFANGIRKGMTPAAVMALADARDRITITGGVASFTYTGTANKFPFQDANHLTYASSIDAAKAGALTKVPTVILTAENEASTSGNYLTTDMDPYANLLGLDSYADWQALAWISGGWADSERRRLLYNHSIFQYPAWRETKAIHLDGGTVWRVFWNYSSATRANHTSDVQYLFGNIEWQVAMNGAEAEVTADGIEMGDAMMRAMRNLAANGDPNTAYSYANGFSLFASPTSFSFTEVDDAAGPYKWNIIGNATGTASGAPVQSTYTDYFNAAWTDYLALKG